MAKSCFLSFHYEKDAWRVQTVKNMGAIDEQTILKGNEWEEIKRGGKAAIQKWIDEQMKWKSCVIVLIGAETAGREWVEYEIKKGWGAGKGVLGINIHNLLDQKGDKARKGANPFDGWKVGDKPLSNWAITYDPPYADSKDVYSYISNNVEGWVDEAIRLRKNA